MSFRRGRIWHSLFSTWVGFCLSAGAGVRAADLTSDNVSDRASAVAQRPTPVSPPVAISPGGALSPEQIRAAAQGKVFQLVTRVNGGSDKQSYGTAFVVGASGWLLTNFHVVAQALADPSRYSLELLGDDKSSLSATIHAFDVANDLALVKVGKKFQSEYKLSSRALSPGEKLYSLGLPQDTVMSIVEGLYSDTGRLGPLQRSLLSAPLNAGMSGGPVLNAGGELVAVNDAILPRAQNISILVPGAAIAAFLLKALNTPEVAIREPAAASRTALEETIPAQISAVLKPWIAEWHAQNVDEPVSLAGYRIAPPPPGLKCWEDEKVSFFDRENTRARVCSTLGAFPILPERTGGSLTLRYQAFGANSPPRETPAPASTSPNEKTGSSVWSLASQWGFARLFAGELFVESALHEASVRFAASARSEANPRPTAVCHHRFLKNKHGVELVAEYCLSADHPLGGVYDLVLTATPLAEEDRLVAELDLGGFTGPELLSAGEAFLDGISRTGSEEGSP